MSSCYQATCECGYEIDGLVDGTSSEGLSWAIAQCQSCRQIISISDGGAYQSCAEEFELFLCPCCGSADIYLLPDLEHSCRCPGCKRDSLHIRLVAEPA